MVFGDSFGDRFSLRITLFLVLVGLSGLFVEIINAFEYIQGARSVFKVQKRYQLFAIEAGTWVQEKVDVDCSGSKNKCSSSGSISFKDDFNLSELSTMVD